MHLIGDIHQPLHIEDAYRGGNEIRVCFAHACASNNLQVWDKYTPHKIAGIKNAATHEEEKSAGASWADKLFNLNSQTGVSMKEECTDITNLADNDLSQAYFKKAVPIVEELIGKAGARLGAWLNALAANAPSNVLADAGLVREDL
ncbi:hypothetical protein EG329_006570 [Mollisiaceae sp. DMI_Dod_QoI]|nr:hypothetical protein EG329_006570 [Helotiales sp. DMI_Dod_QoI]